MIAEAAAAVKQNRASTQGQALPTSRDLGLAPLRRVLPVAPGRATLSARACLACHRVKGLIEVSDEVAHVLETHGEPKQRIGDAPRLAYLLGDRAVRHADRMAAERLYATQALCQREDAQ